MTFGSERTASRRDFFIFVICFLLSVLARIMPSDWSTSLASAVRSTLGVPFVALQRQAELSRTSRKRFATVVAERDSFALVADSVAPLRMENDQLRAVLGLRGRLPVSHVTAEVLHQSVPTNDYAVTLSAGRAQGVRMLAPVLAPKGLLGVITGLDANTSVAMLWAHPDFRASAMTLDGSVFGIVAPYGSKGPNQMLMELSGIPYREQIPAGAMVYTSGMGDVYPKGIPLGTILSVGTEAEGWSRTYLVLPIVHPAEVSHVIILIPGTATPLQPAFRPPTPSAAPSATSPPPSPPPSPTP